MLNLMISFLKDPSPKVYICRAKRNCSNTEHCQCTFLMLNDSSCKRKGKKKGKKGTQNFQYMLCLLTRYSKRLFNNELSYKPLLEQQFSTRGYFVLPWDIWQQLETFFFFYCHDVGRGLLA